MIFLGGLVRIKICFGTINSTEIKATAVLPFVEDLSEKLRCCIRLRIHAIFKRETTLRLHLARPIDAVDLARQGGGVYIGETAKPERQEVRDHNRDTVFDLLRHNLHCLRACPQHRTPHSSKRSKLYWSWSPLLHAGEKTRSTWDFTQITSIGTLQYESQNLDFDGRWKKKTWTIAGAHKVMGFWQ